MLPCSKSLRQTNLLIHGSIYRDGISPIENHSLVPSKATIPSSVSLKTVVCMGMGLHGDKAKRFNINSTKVLELV